MLFVSMSHQANNLNKRGCAFSLVLNDSGADLFKSSSHVLRTLRSDEKDVVFCAVIFHGLDYIDDEGRYKTPHYHVVITFESNYRVETILNWVADLFYANKNQISIEKCNSVPMQVRYLIHKDDLDKYQYKEYEITCIEKDKDYVHRCMLMIKQIIDVDDLLAIMDAYPRLRDLIRVIGADNYRKYRSIIIDLRKEY